MHTYALNLAVAASLAWAIAACAANPTPYPANEDGIPGGGGGGTVQPDTMAPDTMPPEPDDVAPTGPEGRSACEAISGAWEETEGSCGLDVQSAADDPDQGGAGEQNYADSTAPVASVLAVTVSGEPDTWTFSVLVESPDTGCDEYADWWEVVTLDGELLYRRVLTHSHVDEQPFERDGGPVAVAADEPLIVRAHMHPSGYGGAVAVGTIDAGFAPGTVPFGFAGLLADEEPLPTDCAF